jgi:DNA-binding NarL/FixJ family response regulator
LGTGEGKLADSNIRVLLADDHAMFRQGIKEMLSTDEEIEVVGEAQNGQEAVALARELGPDVVILDVEMPVMGAKQAMEIMLENSPPPKVVIVTMYDDPRLVRELIGLGAVAYLVKSATMEELHAAVHAAANSPVGPEKDVVIVAPLKAFRNAAGADGLSERELEVLLMVARGMSNHQIAVSLHLSEATIKRHLANIYPRIGVSSRGEAVREALSKSWISARDITSEEVQSS